MTWLRRVRPVLFVVGGALVVGSLFGARALTAGGGGDAPKSAGPPPHAVATGGPVVLGTVDSDPPPVEYRLPAVLQSGTVSKVFVKDGQTVTRGDEEKGIPADKLYEFDSAVQKRNLAKAGVAVLQARNEVAKAQEAKKQHVKKIAILAQTVEAAKQKVDTAASLYNLIKTNVEVGLKSAGVPEAQWKEKLASNPDLFKANADYADALSARDRFQAELDMLKTADIDLLVKQAEIAVKQAEEEQATAQTVLDLCTVTAKTDGVIEQVKVREGATLGISTREPALWLIPGGKRVVRAEVEADFAHRISNDLIDKEVTIMDHTDPKLTYKGTVRRVGGTFLPKRSEGFMQSDTKVLEAVIDVVDATPAGRPPLRVGQRVRVNLGQ